MGIAFRAIVYREWASHFRSPVAYVFLVAFVIGWVALGWFPGQWFNTRIAHLGAFFNYLPWLAALLVPAATMRLLAEERRHGTTEWLLTLPLTPTQVVVGKWFATVLLLGLALLLTAPLVMTAFHLGPTDPGTVVSSYLGAWLLLGATTALTLPFSAISRAPTVAFVLSASALGLLLLPGWNWLNALLLSWGWTVDWVDALARCSLPGRFESMSLGLWESNDVAFFVGATFAGLGATILLLAPSGRRSPGPWLATTAGAAAIVAAIFGLFPGQWDWTGARVFTPGSEIRQAAATAPVGSTVTFYTRRRTANAPIFLKNGARQLELFLAQVAAASGERLRLVVREAPPDSPAEREARRWGLATTPLSEGESWLLGAVVASPTEHVVLPSLVVGDIAALEYDVAVALQQVSQTRRPRLGLLSMLPLYPGIDPELFSGLQRETPAPRRWAVAEALDTRYDVVRLAASEPPNFDDLDALVLLHPPTLGEAWLRALDRYVGAGRPLLVALDPQAIALRRESAAALASLGVVSLASDLRPLLRAWGIRFDPQFMVADATLAAVVPLGGGQTLRYPAWLRLNDHANPALPWVRGWTDVLLPVAGAFSRQSGTANDLRTLPLLLTSARGTTVDTALLRLDDPRQLASMVPKLGQPQWLAVLLEGTFPSAFPTAPETTTPRVAGRVILLGDSDLVADAFAMSQEALQRRPANANLNVLLDSLDYLLGSPQWGALRTKGRLLPRFTRVEELEAEAEENWAEELQRLEDQLGAVRLEIERVTAETPLLAQGTASPEARRLLAEAADREESILETRRQVRARRRAEVEALESRLLALNLALVPAGLVLFGIIYLTGRYRRRAAAAAAPVPPAPPPAPPPTS